MDTCEKLGIQVEATAGKLGIWAAELYTLQWHPCVSRVNERSLEHSVCLILTAVMTENFVAENNTD